MAAQPVYDASDYVRNLEMLCNASYLFTALAAIIEIWRLANFEILTASSVGEYDRNRMVKLSTMFMVGLQTDLNCYPLGYDTARLYDLDGNPVIE
jgi:hypothetical protein